MVRVIDINLDKLLEKGRVAVRRAFLLASFGLNPLDKLTSDDLGVKSNSILTQQIFPQNIDEKQLEDLKKGYTEMVLRNSLREFIEGISLFYTEVFNVCVMVLQAEGTLTEKSSKKYKIKDIGVIPTRKEFKNKSFKEKIAILKNKLGICTTKDDFFLTVNMLRNIHSHHDGYVPEQYVDDTGQFMVTWLGLDILISENEGETHCFSTTLSEPLHVQKGGSVGVKFSNRKKIFKEKEFARISTEEFVEICFCADLALREYTTKIIDFMKNHGVLTKEKGKVVQNA